MLWRSDPAPHGPPEPLPPRTAGRERRNILRELGIALAILAGVLVVLAAIALAAFLIVFDGFRAVGS